MQTSHLNPYDQSHFFSFFLILLKRVWSFATLQTEHLNLASDEVQVLVLIAISCSSACVGTFMLLKKMTMLANSLSHTILLGIVVMFLFNSYFFSQQQTQPFLRLPLLVLAAFLTALVTTFLTQTLQRVFNLKSDASCGLVFTTLFALGIVLVSIYTSGTHIGVELVMGNVDSLMVRDLSFVCPIVCFNLFLFFFFYRQFQITSFDPAFADVLGIKSSFYNYLIMLAVAVNAICAFRAVGVLMVLAFIVFPPLTARLFTHRLKTMIFYSMGIGSLASFLGVALSRHLLSTYYLALSTGGIVVCLLTIVYVLAIFFSLEQGLVYRLFKKNKVFDLLSLR